MLGLITEVPSHLARDCHCLPGPPDASRFRTDNKAPVLQTLGPSQHTELTSHEGPCRKGQAGVSGKDATQLHSKNIHKNTSQRGTAARKEFLLQDSYRLGREGQDKTLHEVLTLGSVNTRWAVAECWALCCSSPHASSTPSHTLWSTSHIPLFFYIIL